MNRNTLRFLPAALAIGVMAATMALTSQPAQAFSLSSPPAISQATAGRFMESVRTGAKGFTFGPTGAPHLYVFFDPQCPHCSDLWFNIKELKDKVQFTWVPIGFTPRSLAQSVTIMSAKDPVQVMNAHEDAFRLGRGGIAPDARNTDIEKAVKQNQNLMIQNGVTGVPFLIGSDRSGRIVFTKGAVPALEIEKLLNLK